MTSPVASPSKAQALRKRLGLSCDHLMGMRFAINVFIATIILWSTLKLLSDSNPIWAIASMVAASDPQSAGAHRLFRTPLVNVLVGCAVGLCLLLLGSQSDWMIPFALAVTVLISSYQIQLKTMWRQAPFTAAIVIAAGISPGPQVASIQSRLHTVAEVVFGCVVGLLVSWLMSKVWHVRPPAQEAEQTCARPTIPTTPFNYE
jgi:uncharacterized membrane protein YccC